MKRSPIDATYFPGTERVLCRLESDYPMEVPMVAQELLDTPELGDVHQQILDRLPETAAFATVGAQPTAMRLARLARLPLDDVLSGLWALRAAGRVNAHAEANGLLRWSRA